MNKNNPSISKEHKEYIQKVKRNKLFIRICQCSILLLLIILWELFAQFGVIDSFIMSSPSRIIKTFVNLKENELLVHLWVTCYETIVGFLLGIFIGMSIAILLWWSKTLSKIAEPFLVILNSLPKIALGPVIIVWAGAGTKAIILMALAISLIVTVLEMLNGFKNTDTEKIKMAATFGANKFQIFKSIVFTSNLGTLFNSMKINIGLSLVGVIAGEFLVSKAGLGYLIVYGGQVFKLDLVMSSVIILSIVAALMYQGVVVLEKCVNKYIKHQAS